MPFLHTHAKHRCARLTLGAVILSFVFAISTSAQTTAAIAQGFQTSETNTAPGALMCLKPGSPNTVQLANTDRVEQLIGVVGVQPLIALTNSSQQIQVVTSGVTNTLVSDINGDVKTGDKITASPIDGVGMKATEASEVVGTAQADLSSVKTSTQTIVDTSGTQKAVRVGSVPVQISVTYYSPTNSSAVLPGFLQNFANSVAGHDVSVVRVLIAAVVLLLAFLSIAILLYSAVRSSIISIGRNPLSEGAVRKSLLQVGLTIIGILLITLITIYLILIT